MIYHGLVNSIIPLNSLPNSVLNVSITTLTHLCQTHSSDLSPIQDKVSYQIYKNLL